MATGSRMNEVLGFVEGEIAESLRVKEEFLLTCARATVELAAGGDDSRFTTKGNITVQES